VNGLDVLIYADSDHKTILQSHNSNENGDTFIYLAKNQYKENEDNSFFLDLSDPTLKYSKYSATFNVTKDNKKFEQTFGLSRIYYVVVIAQ
jgi:hypothetical protein